MLCKATTSIVAFYSRDLCCQVCLAHSALNCHSRSITAIHAKTKQEGKSDPVYMLIETHHKHILERESAIFFDWTFFHSVSSFVRGENAYTEMRKPLYKKTSQTGSTQIRSENSCKCPFVYIYTKGHMYIPTTNQKTYSEVFQIGPKHQKHAPWFTELLS